jgi:hypothetical protein
MQSLFALSIAHTRDVMRRPSTLVLAVVGVVLILSLRWFSAFGLGYEVVQLKELGTYTAGMLGAIGAVMFWLPREDESDSAQSMLLTRPVSTWTLSSSAFLGRALVLAGLCLLWTFSIAGALLWFKLADPHLFGYRGAESVTAECLALASPMLGQWLAVIVLLALVQPLAQTRRPLLIAAGALGVYVLGYAAGVAGGVAGMLPQLSRLDATEALWGSAHSALTIWQILYACAFCVAGIALDSGTLRLRTA